MVSSCGGRRVAVEGGGRPLVRARTGGERVAVLQVAALVAGGEPALSLGRGAVGPGVLVDPAARLLLDAVVADRGRGRQRRADVRCRQRLEEGRAVAGRRRRRVVGPDPGQAVGHQLGADRAAGRALGVLLRAVEQAEDVLDVMAVLVGDDVLLGQGPAVRAEPAGQLVEEGRVDVDPLVEGAVERPDVVGRRTAGRLLLARVDDDRRVRVALADRRQGGGPVGLDAVGGADDPALGRTCSRRRRSGRR